MQKSRSFPEGLKDLTSRENSEHKVTISVQAETIQRYKEKDHERTEQLAHIGSPSSSEMQVVVHVDWRARCCHWWARVIDYFLEREEESRKQDEIIQSKSYAGFYYFIKWLIRSLFFLIFTTLGTISGKEVGCEIKDHDTCNTSAIELVDSSPHIVASIIGSLFGLIVGQWLGRYVWDRATQCTQHCLRRIEKLADRSKLFLIITAAIVYITVTASFAAVFFFFIDLNQDDENIIGAVVGGMIGLVCAVLAYRKSSTCQTGQRTPMVRGIYNDEEIPSDLYI